MPGGVQGLDRYAYVNNNPVKYTDPDGHKPKIKTNNLSERLTRHEFDPISYPVYEQFIAEAIYYFESLGYTIVGNPFSKSIYSNGADLLFTAKDGITILAVELKNVAGSINLGNIGRASTTGYYGGSIQQLIKSAERFQSSSTSSQLQMESKIILDAFKSGNLQNALFTTSQHVSEGAKNLFNGVFTINANNDTVDIVKGIGGSSAPSIFSTFRSGLDAFGRFTGGCEIVVPIIIFPYPIPDYPWKSIDS